MKKVLMMAAMVSMLVSCGGNANKAAEADDQMSMMDLRGQNICAALERITLETLTPIEAMNELYRLKKMLN